MIFFFDEEMDSLRRSSFAMLLGDDWQHGVEAAVDMALLGRYYERIADHAVSVAHLQVLPAARGHDPARLETERVMLAATGVFLLLTAVIFPLAAVLIVAGYGFLVWMWQLLFAGPPTGP